MDVAPHPHIGLQTVTWLLAGEIVHDDSLQREAVRNHALFEVVQRTQDQVSKVVAPQERAQDFHIPHRSDVANGLAIADRNASLWVVAIEQPASSLVDHAFVPLEHQFEPINERSDAPRVAISSLPMSLSEHACASDLRDQSRVRPHNEIA
jgi:hypothetical protein